MSVVSSQVSWVEEGDLIGIDFGGLGDPCESIAELKQSPMHVVCSRISVGLSPEAP